MIHVNFIYSIYLSIHEYAGMACLLLNHLHDWRDGLLRQKCQNTTFCYGSFFAGITRVSDYVLRGMLNFEKLFANADLMLSHRSE